MKMKRFDELSTQEAQQLVQEYAQKLHQRAEPITLSTLETFEQWCAIAENVGDPLFATARGLIQRYVRVQERMRAIAAGLSLPPN